VNFDRPERKRLRGHWINETGDFVTISENDKCNFRLGEFEYSGKVKLIGLTRSYHAEFQNEGLTRYFSFKGDDPGSTETDYDPTHAVVSAPSEMPHTRDLYYSELTRGPD